MWAGGGASPTPPLSPSLPSDHPSIGPCTLRTGLYGLFAAGSSCNDGSIYNLHCRLQLSFPGRWGDIMIARSFFSIHAGKRRRERESESTRTRTAAPAVFRPSHPGSASALEIHTAAAHALIATARTSGSRTGEGVGCALHPLAPSLSLIQLRIVNRGATMTCGEAP